MSSQAPSIHDPARRAPWANFLQWTLLILAGYSLARAAGKMAPIFLPWNPDLFPVFTTGCEEESLFSLWKFSQGQPVYSDPAALPFAISYFNWLFYWIYGLFAKGCLYVFHLQPGWLPAVARLLTLGFTLGAAGMTYAIISEAALWPGWWWRRTRLAAVSLCFSTPLFDNWIVTARPDLGALFFDLLGLWAALRYWRRGARAMLVAAIVSFYAAWAFKHNTISSLSALCLMFIARRRMGDLLFTVALSFVLYAATFAIGGHWYRFAILFSQKYCTISWSRFWFVLQAAFDAAPGFVVGIAGLIASAVARRSLPWTSERRVLFLASILAWIVTLAGSAKYGSYVNYYFEPSILSFAWLVGLYAGAGTDGRAPAHFRLPFLLSILALAMAALIDAAGQGVQMSRDLKLTPADRRERRETRSASNLRTALRELPPPVLIAERRYNLPWIQTHPPHFVVAYTYSLDRAGGRVYQGGGLAGLVADGYFQTIVTTSRGLGDTDLTVATGTTREQVDGQPLSRYELHHSDANFSYFTLRTNSLPVPKR